jgi:outer membrane protein TolC
LAREKIRLYEELESSQREKLDFERSRQKSGRSTIAQVILFETDYEQTQFARIRSLAEVLSLNANMKLYGVAYGMAKPSSGAGAAD